MKRAFLVQLFLSGQLTKIDRIAVGITEDQIDGAPRLLCGRLDDLCTHGNQFLMRSMNIIYRKSQCNRTVFSAVRLTVIVERQHGFFFDDKLMNRIIATFFDIHQLTVKVSQTAYVVCQQAYFAKLDLSASFALLAREGFAVISGYLVRTVAGLFINLCGRFAERLTRGVAG